MSENKKIRFTAEDGGVEAMLHRLSGSAKNLAQEMIAASLSTENGGRDTVRVLEDQIKAMERKAAIEEKSKQVSARMQYDEDLKWAKSAAAQRVVKSTYAEDMKRAADERKSDDLQISLLRDIVAAIHETSHTEILEDKKSVEKRISDFDKGRLRDLTDEEEYKLEYQRSLLDKESKERKDSNWLDVAKGVLAADAVKAVLNRVGMVVSTFAAAKDEVQVQAKLWEGVPFVGPGLAAAQERHIENAEQRGKLGGALAATTGYGMAPDEQKLEDELVRITKMGLDAKRKNAETLKKDLEARGISGDKLNKSLFGLDESLPEMLGGLSDDDRDFIIKKRQERKDLNRIIDDYTKGEKDKVREAFERREREYRDAWSYHEAGYDQLELLPVATQLAKVSGYRGNLPERTKDYIAMMKGRGLSEGVLSSMAGMERYDTGTALASKVASMENLFIKSGIISGADRSRLEESLNIVAQIEQGRMSRGLERTNLVKMAAVKSAFESAGGSFANTSGTISGIDAALSNPGSDFQEAMNFKIYSQQMAAEGKTATYLGFKKWQEQGIGAEGLMSGRMRMIKGMFGEGDMAELAYKNLFGLKSYDQAQSFSKLDAKAFDKLTGDITATGDRYRGAVSQYTTEREKSQADINDAFTTSMEAGLIKVFLRVGEAIAEKIMTADLPFSDELGEQILKWMESIEK